MRTCPSQSKPNWMRLVASPPLATHGQMSCPKRERVTTLSNPSCTIRTRQVSETSKAIIGYIGNFILRAKGGERWPDVVTPPLGWDEKGERWKRAAPILERPHALRRRGRQWHCEACGKYAGDGAAKAKLARTECVEHPATAQGEHERSQCHLLAQTGSFVWCSRCGARAAKFGHPRTQECARSTRLLSSGWHPRKIAFLVQQSCSVHCASMGKVAAKLPRGQL